MENEKSVSDTLPKKIETKEPRKCPRCKGTTFDPFYLDHCYRCGGIGTVYGPESDFVPYPYAD